MKKKKQCNISTIIA